MKRKRPVGNVFQVAQLAVVALIGISIFALGLWTVIQSRRIDRQPPSEPQFAAPIAPASMEPSAAQAPQSSRESQVESESPGSASATPSAADSPRKMSPEKSASLRRRLTGAIETSLTGALDNSAILDAGLALLDLHVAKGDLPGAAPDGSLRYPLSPCPAGVQAELWVTRSSGSDFENVLALRLQLDAPAEPYVLEGAVRKNPIAHIQAFLDKAGGVRSLVIMTDLAPSGASRRWGLRLDEGRIAEGIIFHVDADQPDDWKAESYGLVDGSDGSWSDPVALLGDPWPGSAMLAQLSSGLLGLLSEARR